MKAKVDSAGNVIGTLWNGLMCGTITGVGMVQSQPCYKPTSWRGGRIESTYEEDEALLQELDDQVNEKKDLYYNVWFYNSNTWACDHAWHHIDPKNTK